MELHYRLRKQVSVRALKGGPFRQDEARRERRLRLLVDSLPIMLAYVDSDRRYRFNNAAYGEWFGRRVEEIRGKFLWEVMGHDLYEQIRTQVDKVLGGERVYYGGTLTDTGGKLHCFEALYVPHRGDGGEVAGFFAMVTEVTERREAAESERLNRQALEHLARRVLTVQEEERRRLARELHDDLSQRMAAMAIEISLLSRRKVPPEARERLGEIKDQILRLSADIHGISRQLHPSIIEDFGLCEAVRNECLLFSRREGIPIRFETRDVPPELPPELALNLFRVLQEGLRNMARHAEASEGAVALTGTEGGVHLRIEDRGVGFDPSQGGRRRGLGLQNMAERVQLMGGELTIRSRRGEGTALEVQVPLGKGAP